MALTGIILRKGPKRIFAVEDGFPPISGELVYATNTGEHGWLKDDIVVWKNLLIDTIYDETDVVKAPAGILPALDGSLLTGIVDTIYDDLDVVKAPGLTLPALDGSLLTGIADTDTIYDDADVVKAPANKLPALDGSLLTNLPITAKNFSVVQSLPTITFEMFETAIYSIDDSAEYVCVSNIVNPTIASELFWFQR